MREFELSSELANKYIICSCEGAAEERITELLIDDNRLWFSRKDLVGEKCTRIRAGYKLASEFLNVDYGVREVAILRIIDRPQENLVLPRGYENVPVFNIVTKPEIEMLHIIAENLQTEFESGRAFNKKLNPSGFCQEHFSKRLPKKIKSVKSADFIDYFYGGDISKLINAIECYARNYTEEYTLSNLLRTTKTSVFE